MTPNPTSGIWGIPEALLGWFASMFVSTLIFIGVLTVGDYSAFVPQRPGGHLGRAAAQVASENELIDRSVPVAWQLLLLFPGWLVLLGVAWLFGGAMGRSRPGWSLRGELRDIPLGVGAGLVLQVPILVVVVLLMNLIFGELQPSGRALSLVDGVVESPFLVILLIVCVAVGAPIVEELFYRGLLQPALIRLTNVPIGIGLASAIFGAVHFSLVEFLPLTVVGLVLGLLAHRTGRLLPAVIAHMTFNAFTLSLLLLGQALAEGP